MLPSNPAKGAAHIIEFLNNRFFNCRTTSEMQQHILLIIFASPFLSCFIFLDSTRKNTCYDSLTSHTICVNTRCSVLLRKKYLYNGASHSYMHNGWVGRLGSRDTEPEKERERQERGGFHHPSRTAHSMSFITRLFLLLLRTGAAISQRWRRRRVLCVVTWTSSLTRWFPHTHTRELPPSTRINVRTVHSRCKLPQAKW